ncbi:hypothetical protein S7711_04172 [Stachybotrys chartarum IBT 7711]|uniref:Enoyl reductase (ER) domain-containing protein n=1 Tax=Stachybotrys chartarum (strain CBS 109288 / IBT 7711) TaxID=1280523 RepID=A0A084B6M8_STACB|nr:hypothetical protein S7711_04172 [Stachybotrys chartarum IBT 7711]
MQALVSKRSVLTRLANHALGASIGGQGGQVLSGVPIPITSPDEVLVKVKAVALNPTDYKHLDVISPPNSIIGCDFAGVVHSVGQSASSKWKVGDRVAGAVHGGLYPDRGSFAEYLKADADLIWRVPDDMPDTDAATYGVSAVTAVLSLNVRHGIPFVEESKHQPRNEAIFIYAGATSAGLYHIQLAKAVGYTVITTASPRSFDLVKSYGADAVYNYKSSTVSADITRDYPHVTKAVDCFSEGKSTSICAEVLKPNGGKVVTLLPNGKPPTSNIQYEMVMAYTVFGRPFQWLPPIGPKFNAVPADREAAIRFYQSLPRLIQNLKPIPTTELKTGFEGILEGLNALRAGQVVGSKQVVRFV